MHSSTTCESSSLVAIEKHWLAIEDKQIITENKWLNDRIIYVAQLLIKRHCPDINGFQSSQLGKLYNFKKASSPFIQILNIKKKSHWVVATVNCEPGIVNLYDSAYAK